MKTVAIVCEYNPFHNGHKYQIDQVKREFGEDTAIIAIMSGNYVERGDIAILGKFQRARMAVEEGVSLVLELPFPYSLASAEHFARAAVEIAHKLGNVDVLSFGSECGDVERLNRIAKNILSARFEEALKKILCAEDQKSLGYARARALAYESVFGDKDACILLSPNNILAIEYLKAIHRIGTKIIPHTVLRTGTDKDGADEKTLAGATFIRSLITEGKHKEALLHLPIAARMVALEALKNGEMPASLSSLSPLLLSSLRMEESDSEIAECGGGLRKYLSKKANEAGTLQEFFSSASTKKYTDARIRRATLYSYFGVTPVMLHQSVLYTQVLAMNGIGQAVLHDIRKTADIAIVTKPADLGKLSLDAKAQAERAYRADSVYALALPKPRAADFFLRTSPYRK